MKLIVLIMFLLSLNATETITEIDKRRVKKRAKKDECYIYVDINGNDEWEDKKSQLKTEINAESPFCNRIVIVKVIRNVHLKSCRKSWNDVYSIGTVVEENFGVDITTMLDVKNSSLGCKLEGTVINDSDSMSDIENRVKIEKSRIGEHSQVVDNIKERADAFMNGD
jgi:3-keto-L-gulonate-6-phosphate decarboxylase